MTRYKALPAALLLALAATPAVAGEPVTVDSDVLKSLLERVERLEAQATGQGAAPAADSAAEAEVIQLKQRLAILERKLELADEAAAAKAPTTPTVTVNDKGLAAKTPDGEFEIRLRGNVQVDQRTYLGDAPAANDTFGARRIEPILEGSLGKWLGFRIKGEFAGDSATLAEAYADLRFDPAYTLRVGKFKAPVGLERLQSSSSLAMLERAYPTELAPNQDIGVQLQGELAQGEVTYAVGAFNGVADGRDSATTDADDDIEWAGRVFFEPWKNEANALSGLGFGLAGSVGDKHGTGNAFLPRYRTPGQLTFFGYRSAVAADGRHVRWSPQAYFYRNRFGAMAEAIRSAQEVSIGGVRTELEHEAWQLTASWVLTGEDAGYRGVAKPNRPFALDGEGWGAFEVVGRIGALDVDDDAFPLFADPAVAATRARSWGLGLNWYLTSSVKLATNYVRTDFDGGAPADDRNDEDIFFSRVQVAF
jgi:phosphate-selective porin OprO/OprP